MIEDPRARETFGLPEPPERVDYETDGGPRTERILIIEDDPDIARFIKVNLNGNSFPHVTIAEDGQAGLALTEQEDFELVLTGFMMPGVLGDEVVRRLRARPQTRHLPVIMVTSQSGTTHIRRAMLAGADDYVTKPFDPIELMARIRAVLRRPER